MKKIIFVFTMLATLQASAQLVPVLTQSMSKSPQTITPNSSFAILFDKTEVHEATNTGSNGYSFKAAVAGLYKMESAITLKGGSVGANLIVFITRNGSVIRRYSYYISQTQEKTFEINTDIPLKAGETLGFNLNLSGSSPGSILDGSHAIYSRYSFR